MLQNIRIKYEAERQNIIPFSRIENKMINHDCKQRKAAQERAEQDALDKVEQNGTRCNRIAYNTTITNNNTMEDGVNALQHKETVKQTRSAQERTKRLLI